MHQSNATRESYISLRKQLKTLTRTKTILQAIEILGLLVGGELNIQEFFLVLFSLCFPAK